MDELQAAILNVKMAYLDTWNAQRQAHAQSYSERLESIVEQVPVVRPWASHVFYLYVVQVPERGSFRKSLEQAGVATGIHYPIPIHLQPACRHYGYTRGMLPITEASCERIVSLPMYPEMTEQQVEMVVDAVKRGVLTSISRAGASPALVVD